VSSARYDLRLNKQFSFENIIQHSATDGNTQINEIRNKDMFDGRGREAATE
jgi:hypothetical protein